MTVSSPAAPARGRSPGGAPILRTRGLSLAYDGRAVVEALDLDVQRGAVTAIVGPNGCGKSTVLRGLSRLLRPDAGTVLLAAAASGTEAPRDIRTMRPKAFARRVALLPQTPPVPEGITVVDLVGRGRHPHHSLVRRRAESDDEAVAVAMRATDTLDLADRHVEDLSGGQRQRVWIALTLAQHTDIILLDEPTTYLDVAHQIDVLDLLVDLNRRRGTTIVMVLHDLNLAVRYADDVVALCGGRLVAQGRPADVVDEAFVHSVFGLESQVIADPVTGTPLVVPAARSHLIGPTA